jgi:hypothetical protein
MLGDKSIYQFLKKSKQFEFKLMKNDSILDELKLDAFETAMHGVYMKSAISIIEEIKMIINENKFLPPGLRLIKHCKEFLN